MNHYTIASKIMVILQQLSLYCEADHTLLPYALNQYIFLGKDKDDSSVPELYQQVSSYHQETGRNVIKYKYKVNTCTKETETDIYYTYKIYIGCRLDTFKYEIFLHKFEQVRLVNRGEISGRNVVYKQAQLDPSGYRIQQCLPQW